MPESLIQPGFDFLTDMPVKPQGLAEEFLVPPFSVLDARQGYWQERKRQWIALGIKSEVGRGDTCLFESEQIKEKRTLGAIPPNQEDMLGKTGKYKKARAYSTDLMRGEDPNYIKPTHVRGTLGKSFPTIHPYDNYTPNEGSVSVMGTSIFDPVLCELAYRWFCPTKGHILDPFAGGSVRGIVAEYLGYKYTGVEIRPEQVEANQEQAKAMSLAPNWILGDSAKLLELLPKQSYDMVFTCPPYYDLEEYSDEKGDLSNKQSYYEFKEWYYNIFNQAVARLQIDRFLVVVVGEIRDNKGIYRNFIGDNIAIFNKMQLKYYNEAILITSVGSLPIRTAAQFPQSRKLGKGHQNILVFYKGNPDRIRRIPFHD